MPASLTRALSRRSRTTLIVLVAIACAVAITIASVAQPGAATHRVASVRGPESTHLLFASAHRGKPRHPHRSRSNAGYGLNA